MRIIIISLLSVLLQLADNQCLCQELLYKKGRPTSEGIRQYVEENQEQFFQDFRDFVQDSTLEDTWITTDDLSTYYQHDSLELGCFYFPNEIIITTEELFVDYELQYLQKYRRQQYRETNQFCKAVVMHEICHYYIYTVMQRMKYAGQYIAPEYLQTLRVFPYNYGAEFCEEGLCEYLPCAMQEMLCTEDYSPRSADELLEGRNTYAVKYRYSRVFVTPVVRKYGLGKAIEVILGNPAPSIAELLHPQNYYARLREN